MNLGKQKKIAVVISKPTAEYQRSLLSSIAKRAAAAGYYTLTYAIFGGYGNNESFVRGERMLADLPNFRIFDGIILCLDTFTDDHVVNRLLEKVKNQATCPVVCVRRQYDGYNSVLVDDENSMEGIVEHLVSVHRFHDFCYVSGPKDHPDAIHRLNCFRRMMEKYKLSFTDEDIFYGDFWRNMGDAAVSELLDTREAMPEVIVCANDFMAIAVCNSLADRGVRVPDDIVVTGFDDVREAEATIPSLTSVCVDVETMGVRAVDMLVSMIRHENVPEIEYVPTHVVVRESCGCEVTTKERAALSVRRYFDEAQLAEHYNMQTVFMSIDVENTTNMDQLNEYIYNYIFNNDDFRDFFIVLNDFEWGTAEAEEMSFFTKKMHLRTAIQENILLGHVDQVFFIDDILPEEYVYDAPCGYYIVPLHFQEQCYGYAMINFRNDEAPGHFFQYIITIIGNVLERLRITQRMQKLVDKLSGMYVSDVLTGLKNRYGFEEDSQKLYEQVKGGGGHTLAIISIDMDDLKGINDTYGHANGDIALKAIANAIYAACYANELCYRVGGDEFQVLAFDYTEEDVARYYERFEGFLDDYNSRSKRPYLVRASYGHSIANEDAAHTLGEWMTLSDDRMYANKAENKKHRSTFREET